MSDERPRRREARAIRDGMLSIGLVVSVPDACQAWADENRRDVDTMTDGERSEAFRQALIRAHDREDA